MGRPSPELLRSISALLERGLPILGAPFAAIADDLGVRETDAIEATRVLLSEGFLRHFGAFVDFRPLGFVGYLFGVKVDEEAYGNLTSWLAGMEYVTHIYERLSPVNLWFTAILSGDEAALGLSDDLCGRKCPHVALAAVRRIKLKPSFARAEGETVPGRIERTQKQFAGDFSLEPGERPQVLLSPRERKILYLAQRSFSVEGRPFVRIGREAEVSEEEALACLRKLASLGVLRRIGASLHHMRSGYSANSLIAWDLSERPEAEILSAASRIAGNDWLSHCYLRRALVDTLESDWRYNLYTMIHARSDDELREREGALASALRGCAFVSMRTKREWKKTSYRIEAT